MVCTRRGPGSSPPARSPPPRVKQQRTSTAASPIDLADDLPAAAAAPSSLADCDSDSEVEVLREKTWAERDAELRRAAIDLCGSDSNDEAEAAPVPTAVVVKPEALAAAASSTGASTSSVVKLEAGSSSSAVKLETVAAAAPPSSYRCPISFDRLYNEQRRGVAGDDTPAPAEATVHLDAVREAMWDCRGEWITAAPPPSSADGRLTRQGRREYLYAAGAAGLVRAELPLDYVPLARRPQEARRAPAEPEAPLNREQSRALELASGGESLFMTGGAGVGKSFTLSRLIRALQHRLGPQAVAVTASTGIAACHIGGTTLHSFAGIGLGEASPKQLVNKMNRHKRAQWHVCQVLIIDEVSMLDAVLFDKLDQVARIVLGEPRLPFGGLQLVLSGDFFQLPPVGLGKHGVQLLFEAEAWPALFAKNTVLLHQVFRQKEEAFASLLNEMRRAQLSPFSLAVLSHAQAHPPPLPHPTKLVPHNETAEAFNSARLEELPGRMWTHQAVDYGKMKWLLKDLLVPATLELKVGAQVMLLKNLDPSNGLVNGSRGVVTELRPAAPTSTQWAGGAEQFGAADAALAAGRAAITALAVIGGVAAAAPAPAAPAAQTWPVVEFTTAHGKQTRFFNDPKVQGKWSLEQQGDEVAIREQVPLKLAWAISIHKSQGMTLASSELDLGRCFDYGQAYAERMGNI